MNLPDWVKTFARKYFSKNISTFILHGNINDLVRVESDTSASYSILRDYLNFELFKKRDIVIWFDRANGITFKDPNMRKDFMSAVAAYDTLNGTDYSKQGLPKNPQLAFAIIETFLKVRLNDKKKIALILDYAETLVPMGTTAYYSAEDRSIQVYLQKWAQDKIFLESDMTTVLLTENIGEINQSIVKSAYSCEIELFYPDENSRLLFIDHLIKVNPTITQFIEMKSDILAKNTAGVSLFQLKALLAEVLESKIVFSNKELMAKKKTIIESEAGGLLEFVETKFNLDFVAGHKYAKAHLKEASKALLSGRGDVLPMGYLVNGPVGTGKTFLISCFAADIGVPMVLLKNFRSQWQGQTEANLEKVLRLLKAMNPVAVMIDEADAYLGNRSASGDSGVSSRVFSMLANFMSNTENRGKIIWFLLTARPDLLPVDFKRQGRAEEHIALFYPETVEEKKELFEVMLKKTGLKDIDLNAFDEKFYADLTITSGADMESALTRSKFKAVSKGIEKPNPELIKEALADFIPPTYPEEIELMNLAAVLECTSKELLPQKFRDMNRAEILSRIEYLKVQRGIR